MAERVLNGATDLDVADSVAGDRVVVVEADREDFAGVFRTIGKSV